MGNLYLHLSLRDGRETRFQDENKIPILHSVVWPPYRTKGKLDIC
jgi:hypothetical protein